MTDCPDPSEMVETRIDRVLTQYRESPNLLFLIRTYLRSVADLHSAVCDLPNLFDIETATGDALTLLGKRLGWPRDHCVCDTSPVFGFDCDDDTAVSRPVVGFGGTLPVVPFGFAAAATSTSVAFIYGTDVGGFCETFPVSWDACEDPDLSRAASSSTWAECSDGVSGYTISNDEVYRAFLKCRIYQMNNQFDAASLTDCIKILFGSSAAILYSGQGRVVICPGRDIRDEEYPLLQIWPRVLPIALGLEVLFHFGEFRVFGFGDGWGGLEEIRDDLTQESVGWIRTGKVFGFSGCGEDVGGFCEDWAPDGLALATEDGYELLITGGQTVLTGPLYENASWACRGGAPWMCEVDVKPYSC